MASNPKRLAKFFSGGKPIKPAPLGKLSVGNQDQIVSESGSVVAQVYGSHAKKLAAMFAATDDMLDALQQCLLHIEGDEMAHGRAFAAGNVARAAIAKAKGVTPPPAAKESP